jgi:hypothetical protein
MAGPIYFAWVNAEESTFDVAFAREDEDVFDLKITHGENQFPVASIMIRNPRIGLLSPGRKQYAWISTDSLDTGGIEPLFFGRIAGQPIAIGDRVIQVAFRARPRTVQEQKEAIAATLRVRPYWDAVWIKPERRLDPETVLESRTALWHYDRLTPTVTVSDIINGEDGIEVFTKDDYFEGSMSVAILEQPLRNIKVFGDVYWPQRATGEVDITDKIVDAFHAGGSSKEGHISTFTGQGLWENWPSQEDTIGGGWFVKSTTLSRSDATIFPNEYVKTSCRYQREPEPTATESGEGGEAIGGLRQNEWGDEGIGWTRSEGYYVCLPLTSQETQGSGLANPDQPVLLYFPLWQIKPTMVVGYDAERQRRETVQFTLSGDVQPLYTDAEDEETEIISFSSSEVAEPIDEEGTDNVTPIYDFRRRQYFTTDRGQTSIEYLLAVARARLLARSRAINITFETTFERAANLNCRKNVTIYNDELPSGSATGKIVEYAFGIDESGARGGTVTIACCVGRGNVVEGTDGEPSYNEASYNDDNYSALEGERTGIMDGAIWYERPSDPPNDDGVSFFDMTAENSVLSCSLMQGGESAQREILAQSYRLVSDCLETLNNSYSRVSLIMRPLSGLSFEQVYYVNVSQLMIPKTIDLEQ